MSVPLVKLNDGNLMPIVGLGTAEHFTKEAIEHAINFGYRHFDSAFLYGSEKILGEAVNEAINEGRVKREEIFFVTKVWPTYYGKGRVIKSAKQSIEVSGLEYIDLLLLHWPFVLEDNDSVDANELLFGEIIYSDYDLMDVYKELEEVKRMGLAKSIGVSNFNSEQIERIVKIAEFIPVTNQVESHPYFSQEKLLKFCGDRNITLTAYSPLGRSYPGIQLNWQPGGPPLLGDENLKQIAGKYSKSVAQVLLRWQTQRGVIVIPRSLTKERIKENIDIFDFTLSEEDMTKISSLNRNYRYLDPENSAFQAHKEYPFNIEF